MEQGPRDRDPKAEEALVDADRAADPARPAVRMVREPAEARAGVREPAAELEKAGAEAAGRAAAGDPDQSTGQR